METKEQLLSELKRIECRLSPENLTCDGELPRSEVRRRAAQLNRERKTVIAKLGYEPSDNEIWGY